MSNDIYKGLYNWEWNADTWTLPADLDLNPRLGAVSSARKKLHDSAITVLDIGCGLWLNSKWIAENDSASNWVGIDYAIIPDIGNYDNIRFLTGDFLDPDFRSEQNSLISKKDLIIDQWAILPILEDSVKLDEYLQTIYNSLNSNWIFLTMFMYGSGTIHFPDGRIRVCKKPEGLYKKPFSDYFEVEIDNQNLSWNYSYKLNSLWENNEWLKITIFHVVLRKK